MRYVVKGLKTLGVVAVAYLIAIATGVVADIVWLNVQVGGQREDIPGLGGWVFLLWIALVVAYYYRNKRAKEVSKPWKPSR
jgi:hypothetical protein